MITDRLKRANELVRKKKLDLMIVTKLSNVRYLSGFSGTNGILALAPPKAYFFTDFRYAVQAQKEVRGCQVKIAEAELVTEIIKLPLFKKKAKVGFEPAIMTVKTLDKLRETLPKASFVPIENLVESLAAIKDSAEIVRIKKAVKITDAVFAQILDHVKPGVKESDLALELNYRMVKMGASGPAFDFIVASGQRSSMPHGRASNKKVRRGEFVTLDFGCTYDGYCSDLTRTVVMGKATEKQKKVYGVVFEAQQAALEAARAGMAAKELDRVARDIIRKRGYGDYFGHGLGHGLGLEVHAGPVVNARSQDVLEAGNVITIEPGIYIPNWGGVRIEDDVLITQNGCAVLTKAQRELIEL